MLRNDLPVYGIDADLAKKAAAKYDPVAEQEAKDWIAHMTGKDFPGGSFGDALKDGTVLCAVINSMIPGSIPNVNTSSMAFKQMENINNFLEQAARIGVPKNDLFQTIDLYEQQNLNQVVLSIHALSRHGGAKGLCPVVGPKLAEFTPRNFDQETLNQSNAILSQQMGYTGGANQSGMSYGGRRQIMK